MFQKTDQGYLDQWIQCKLSEEEFVEIYYKNWTLPWHLYREIFMYARKNRIPMIGLNISSEITRQVAQRGFASLYGQIYNDLGNLINLCVQSGGVRPFFNDPVCNRIQLV